MKQGQYKYISPVYSYTQPYPFSYKPIVLQWIRYTVPLSPPRDAFHSVLSVLLPFVFMLPCYSPFGDRNSQSTGLWRSSPREFLSSLCSQDCSAPKIARSEHDMPLPSPPSHKLIALKNIKKTATTRQRHDNEKRVKAYF